MNPGNAFIYLLIYTLFISNDSEAALQTSQAWSPELSQFINNSTQHTGTWGKYDACQLLCPAREKNSWSFKIIGDQAKNK